MKKELLKEERLFSAEEVRQLLNDLTDQSDLKLYTPAEVQEIFGFKSIDSAYRLMNHPSFPLMKVGKNMRVTKENLKEFIKKNSEEDIKLLY